ncbi:hypothetical protein [Hymenobacter coccineus]|uniref:Uncharacterized protein n=1 Tax=Hymenobacter coccineus TaxID=1908235 RepID=A0A1G1TDR7_9BACT|nr:hypothetical protein [Hymenobacter coccineus]OGX89000.1 hypothetical protein BEN49_01320 [Hymenobacter coccineus]
MDTQDLPNTSAPDQRERAQEARLNPNDPAKEALPSPQYGDFGKPTGPAPTADKPEGRSGSNDNPDEFSEFRDKKEAKSHPDALEDQPGHVMQNQDPAGVAEAQASGAETDELRAAWSKDDPRYAGGGSHNKVYNETPDEADRKARDADKAANTL